MNESDLANQAVPFFMKSFGIDKTAARIIVQGFLPQAIEWPSEVVIEELEGGVILSFPALIAGAASAAALATASAQGIPVDRPSVSCSLPLALREQNITTCKTIDFDALTIFENDLALAGIPVVPSKDEFGRTIRTWTINAATADEATLKWACNETDFAYLAQQPAFGRQAAKDIFSLVRGCIDIVPVPMNSSLIAGTTGSLAIEAAVNHKIDAVSAIKPEVANATAVELIVKSGTQTFSLAREYGTQQFIEFLSEQTGLS
jgi:hypothetical protein